MVFEYFSIVNARDNIVGGYLSLSIALTVLFGWGVFWFYTEHSNLRQMISLLIVSKVIFDTASDDNGTFKAYFQKLKLKLLHKTGLLILEKPVDGQKYMECFSKNEFDNVVEQHCSLIDRRQNLVKIR